jgi:hypothetical protein
MLASGLLLLVERPLTAQQATQGSVTVPPNTVAFPVSSGLADRLGHIRRGALLQIKAASGPRLTAVYLGMVADSAFVRTTGVLPGRVMFADSVWSRHRLTLPYAFRGMWGGALMGAAIQIIGGTRGSCEGQGTLQHPFPLDCHAKVGNIGRAAGIGAIIGGVTGAGIGLLVREWRLRFPLLDRDFSRGLEPIAQAIAERDRHIP